MKRLVLVWLFALASQSVLAGGWGAAAAGAGQAMSSYDDEVRRGQLRQQLDAARARGDYQTANSIAAELQSLQRPAYIAPAPLPSTMHQYDIGGRILTCTTTGNQTQCF